MYLGDSIGGVKMTENEKRMHRACFTGHRPKKTDAFRERNKERSGKANPASSN